MMTISMPRLCRRRETHNSATGLLIRINHESGGNAQKGGHAVIIR